MINMKLLEVKNINKSFDNKEILKDINFNISKGKIVASGSETEIMKNTDTYSIEAAFLKATGTYSEGICE